MLYSENYVHVCEEAEVEAAHLLGRALTELERRTIRGAGTLTWLEMRVQVPMRTAGSLEEMEAVLAAAAEDLEERLANMIHGLSGMIGALLERELSAAEHRQLHRLPDVVAAMQMGEDLTEAESAHRERLFQQMLDEL